uniref:Uncharacterized protein n=1 Tax=Chrysotila carterae TaxID=13221 RepID=A0A7S4C7J5_CHRCT|mmetsp:Transcript_48524/g.105203  ORF Transcript_48524/g.105203 Transcript_48524/m.105203 type:complete len:204 (+) Transcript_48524:493-1104(+)
MNCATPQVQTPFMLIMQHDFLLVRPFDGKRLLETMTSNPLIKHVRLNLRPNVARGFDTVVQNYSGPSLVPLARTCGWADAPHVTSRQYYLSFVIPLLMHDHDGGKRKYVEESVHYRMLRHGNPGGCWEFKNEIAKGNVAAKWPEAFDDYGTYLYGFASAQDGHYTVHRSLRGNAPRWSVEDAPRQLRAPKRGAYKLRKSRTRR